MKKRQESHAKALCFYRDRSLNVDLIMEEHFGFDESRVYEMEEIQNAQKRGRNGCCS